MRLVFQDHGNQVFILESFKVLAFAKVGAEVFISQEVLVDCFWGVDIQGVIRGKKNNRRADSCT